MAFRLPAGLARRKGPGLSTFTEQLSIEMKSAYELAMERLQKQSPATKLTAPQKAEIAEIDQRYKAKRAERELFLNGEIAKAEASEDGEALDQLRRQLAMDLRRIDEECEEKKEKVRNH